MNRNYQQNIAVGLQRENAFALGWLIKDKGQKVKKLDRMSAKNFSTF